MNKRLKRAITIARRCTLLRINHQTSNLVFEDTLTKKRYEVTVDGMHSDLYFLVRRLIWEVC